MEAEAESWGLVAGELIGHNKKGQGSRVKGQKSRVKGQESGGD